MISATISSQNRIDTLKKWYITLFDRVLIDFIKNLGSWRGFDVISSMISFSTTVLYKIV